MLHHLDARQNWRYAYAVARTLRKIIVMLRTALQLRRDDCGCLAVTAGTGHGLNVSSQLAGVTTGSRPVCSCGALPRG